MEEALSTSSAYSFSPVDQIPERHKKHAHGEYATKEIHNWAWRDFYDYFEDSYINTKRQYPPKLTPKEKGKYKSMIETSYVFWGKEVFRSMIDYMFDNHKHYPEWKNISLSLVCGNHYWARTIGEQAQKRVSSQ